MPNTYISFLGTNNYLECFYTVDDVSITKESVRFVQEATINKHCTNWGAEDQILILNTPQAKQENWLDNGHQQEVEGLLSRIKKLKLKTEIKPIAIPSGQTEKEIWDIFEILQQHIREGDHLVLDITHAFRSIPLLALVVINYTKTLKNTQVKNISYGAMEALGNIKEIKNLPESQRKIPIFDLTTFDALLNWTQAINNFELTGNATAITKLSLQSLVPIINNDKEKKSEAILLQKMAISLENLTENIATCRSLTIQSQAKKVSDNIEKVKQSNLLPPFKPLFEKINSISKKIIEDDYNGGFEATNWCIEHNLIQQAYTIFQETLKTWVLLSIGMSKEESLVRDYRELVNGVAKVVGLKIEKDKWHNNLLKKPKITNQLEQFLKANTIIVKILERLANPRNDINHAGYNDNAINAEKLKTKIKEMLKDFENSQAC